jgi:hypothetical protein
MLIDVWKGLMKYAIEMGSVAIIIIPSLIKTGSGEPSARRYIWATLFLGGINTGTWPSRFGESQEFGQ